MPETRQPNILLLLPDQHRFDFMGREPGQSVRTPNLDALAERGVYCTRAFTPSPVCAPARACLASGMSYNRCRVPNNGYDYPVDQPTFYAGLRDSGYRVAGVGKFDLHKSTRRWNLDGSRLLGDWGFTEGIDNEGKHDGVMSGADEPMGPYLAYLHERGLAEAHVDDFAGRHTYKDTYPTPLPDDAYCDNWLTENGLGFLERFPKDRPWFLQVNFTGPHEPMDVTQSMLDRCGDAEYDRPHRSDEWDEETHSKVRRNYSAMIENIDRHVGRFIQAVSDRGELDDTLIVYGSDHGEMLGDHGIWGKSTYRQPSVGIPMVIAGPDVISGIDYDAPTSLHDLAATFLDFADADGLPGMDSVSMKGVLTGRRVKHRSHVVTALDDWRAIFDGRFKLVLRDDAEPILFALEEDPWEDRDIADRRRGPLARLTDELAREGY